MSIYTNRERIAKQQKARIAAQSAAAEGLAAALRDLREDWAEVQSGAMEALGYGDNVFDDVMGYLDDYLARIRSGEYGAEVLRRSEGE
ncbi:hypothetical protein [Glycomyces lechevalierae]|uniref:Uncharacterized protein n=2 Tax=Glycomyces TaxID=58113 RepID=A0ABU2AHX0_9ACTN|nr:hypothetical protein [Glycomyces lechevalierae]MDR7336779.1 hypothetical protein [Glycomyces lechevalierae]